MNPKLFKNQGIFTQILIMFCSKSFLISRWRNISFLDDTLHDNKWWIIQTTQNDEVVEITKNKNRKRKNYLLFSWRFWSAHIFSTLLLRLPKALAPTLVGTKLLLPIPPDRLRKSARRWVTQVAVLQARFCAVTLLQESKQGVNAKIWCDIHPYNADTVYLHTVNFYQH